MIACPGAWKNFEEIEEALSINELMHILDAFRDLEKQRYKFQAALQGVDLDKHDQDAETSFEAVKRRAEAKVRGISEEQLEFEQIGIAMEEF